MRGCHPLALCIVQYTGQKAWLPVGCFRHSIDAVTCKERLHLIPKTLVDKVSRNSMNSDWQLSIEAPNRLFDRLEA
jgi:hypothetical protein